MRIRRRVSMAGKVFPACDHPIVLQASDGGQPHLADKIGGVAKRPIADHGILRITVHIQYRSHVHVDTYSPQLFRNGSGSRVGKLTGITPAQLPAGRKNRKLSRQPGHPTALLINRDQQRLSGRQFLQPIGQIDNLLNRLEVAPEQDDAARRIGFQKRGQVVGDRGPGKPHHKQLTDLLA
jgi:hypothetical protein